MGCTASKNADNHLSKNFRNKDDEFKRLKKDKKVVLTEKKIISKQENENDNDIENEGVVTKEIIIPVDDPTKKEAEKNQEKINQQQLNNSPKELYKLNEVEDGIAYVFPAKAWYTENNQEKQMSIESLELGKNGKIRLKGKDDAGAFKMRGRFSVNGQVYIEKSYELHRSVNYKGMLCKNIVNGNWTVLNKTSGPFRIEFNLLGWEYGNSYLGFSDTTYLSGLFYDDYTKAWGIMFCQKEGENIYLVDIDLADGRELHGSLKIVDTSIYLTIQGSKERVFTKKIK